GLGAAACARHNTPCARRNTKEQEVGVLLLAAPGLAWAAPGAGDCYISLLFVFFSR
ncbi:hypothetical protein A2U01_0112803, partial [Trifolium medium]|nr:hypothetical protein [Trifolium medium]